MNDKERSTEVFLLQKHLLSAFRLLQLQSWGKPSSSRRAFSDHTKAEYAGRDPPANICPKDRRTWWNFFISDYIPLLIPLDYPFIYAELASGG